MEPRLRRWTAGIYSPSYESLHCISWFGLPLLWLGFWKQKARQPNKELQFGASTNLFSIYFTCTRKKIRVVSRHHVYKVSCLCLRNLCGPGLRGIGLSWYANSSPKVRPEPKNVLNPRAAKSSSFQQAPSPLNPKPKAKMLKSYTLNLTSP